MRIHVDPWLADERRTHSYIRELQRLRRRAARRVITVALLAAGLTAAVVLDLARTPEQHTTRVLLRVDEGELSADSTPLPRGELRDYLWHVSFSLPRLLQVVDELGLFAAQRRLQGDSYAATLLRDMVDIEVYRDYFAIDRGYATAPRSARVALRIRGGDPELTVTVARRLVALIGDGEAELRRLNSETAAGIAASAAEKARAAVTARQREVSAALVEMARAERDGDLPRAAQRSIDARHLQEALAEERLRLQRFETIAGSTGLQRSLESHRMGLSFTVVDERVPEPPRRPPWVELAVIGVVTLLLLAPLSALGIAAFDRSIHAREDVERLGIPVIGHVPTFEGCHAGALAHRVTRSKRRWRR